MKQELLLSVDLSSVGKDVISFGVLPVMKNFRIIEELDNGDEVVTYFTVEEYEDGYYYVYNDNEVGPFPTLDDAVEGASADLVPT